MPDEANHLPDFQARWCKGRVLHRGGQPLFTPYSWTYDPLDRIVQMVHSDRTSSYGYDQTDQLVGAEHSYQPDEAYQFDANGTRGWWL